MGLLGISVLVASIVYVIIRPPEWLVQRLSRWPHRPGQIADVSAQTDGVSGHAAISSNIAAIRPENGHPSSQKISKSSLKDQFSSHLPDAAAMPPPPRPPAIRQPATDQDADGSLTPRASAAALLQNVTDFSLSAEPSEAPSTAMRPPSSPARRLPPVGRIPTLPAFPAPNSAQRARGPAPNRGPSSLSPGGLTPPPTHSSKPQKPSRKVILEPGHSPLDWARISGPNSDLRGVDPSSPFLRVTPSMLKKQSGRKGTDAWMALNGKVYNVTPYAKFHPGGIPELMRGAAKDGTRLFGEVHPWVNYETMLSACLIGLLVEEIDGAPLNSGMDEMD